MIAGINNVGVLGTGRASPLGLPGVGLVSDVFQSGWNATNFAGDYTAMNLDGIFVNTFLDDGSFFGTASRAGYNPAFPANRGFMTALFEATSLPDRESVIWEGYAGPILIRFITSIGEDDLFMRTSVILKNIGQYGLKHFYCTYSTGILFIQKFLIDHRWEKSSCLSRIFHTGR